MLAVLRGRDTVFKRTVLVRMANPQSRTRLAAESSHCAHDKTLASGETVAVARW